MRIGRTTFDESIKKVGWEKWAEMWKNNHAARYEMERKGHTCESAFKFLTGKDKPKNVRKTES